jgi:hypothetical protein
MRCLPDGMYLVFDIWHGASTLDEILDDFKILDFSGFETLAIVKDKLLVVARFYFGIDIRYACFGV